MMLARLVYAGHDPERVMDWPQWVWDAIMPYWAALEAEAQLQAIHVAMTPHIKPQAQREVQRELRSYARELQPRRAFTAEPTERDPEKAAEWFAAQGIKVVRSG
jgi:hypothetical protein